MKPLSDWVISMDLPTRDRGRCWQASPRVAGHMPQNDRFKAGQLHVRVPGADPKQPFAARA